MSLGSVTGSITNIVGMGLVAGTAFKVVDMVSQNQPKKKGKKSDNIFDFNFDQPKKRKGKRKANNFDIYGGSFGGF